MRRPPNTTAGFRRSRCSTDDAGERTLSPSRHSRTWTRWAATRAATPLFARFYEKTGDQAYKEKSFRSFNWATYMAHEDGLITEAMGEDNFWYSDGRHNPGQIGPPARGQPSPPGNYPHACAPC